MKTLLTVYIPVSFLTVFLYGKELCDDGWFLAGKECYTVIQMPKTFDDANALCKSSSFNGTMAELGTMGEKKSLVTHLRSTFEIVFIGQLFWVGAHGGNETFYWNSGAPVDYDDYVDGTGNATGCLAFGTTTAEKYQVSDCMEKHIVLCESRPSGNETVIEPVPVG